MFSRHRVDIYRAIEDGLNFDLETMHDLLTPIRGRARMSANS